MKTLMVFGAAALVGVSATIALAHSGATGIVKERMDLMSRIGKDTRAMAAMSRGRDDIDWSLIIEAGKHATMTSKHLPMQFPADSFKSPSEAKETILTDKEGFQAQVDALWLAGLALTTAGETQDEDSFKLAFGAYAQTCKACHSKYRQ